MTLQEFKGKTLLSIREYYFKDGKELPAKGDAHIPDLLAETLDFCYYNRGLVLELLG